jgi:hypothetical protein
VRLEKPKRSRESANEASAGKKEPDASPALEKIDWRGRLLAAVAAAATAAFAAVPTATITATAATATAAVATTAAPATASATAAKATAFAAIAAATERTRGTLLARTGNVNRQGAAFHFIAVKFVDGLLGFFPVRHRDEGKTAGTTGELVEDDLDDADGADLAKQGLEVLGGAGEGKIPHVELVVF